MIVKIFTQITINENKLPPNLNTSCASVANDMHGSFRENNAHDLDLKLIPWKHAKDILTP